MKILTLSDDQAAILRDLLDFNIENLIDEPEDSHRGQQCKDSQAIFDQLFGEQCYLALRLTRDESNLLDDLLNLHIENLQQYDLEGVDKAMVEDLKFAELLSARLKTPC